MLFFMFVKLKKMPPQPNSTNGVLCVETLCTQEPLGHSNLCGEVPWVVQQGYFAHSVQPPTCSEMTLPCVTKY